MNKRCVILAAGVCLAVGGVCMALDTIKKTSGTARGEVVAMSSEKVSLKTNKVVTNVPVNQIVTIFFDGEPTSIKTARTHLFNGRYEDALEALDRVRPDEVQREVIRQDLAFYKALCAARMALAGNGSIKEAGTQMRNFADSNPGSYHFLEANEILGDLVVALGAYSAAEKYYARLANVPWPDYKMRAGVAIGRARLAQGKVTEALRAFESVLAIDARTDLEKSQRLAATLGKARCLAAAAKYDDAVKIVQAVLAKADPEQLELHARAYNTLGAALRKAGRKKEALLAFLHVDVLYFGLPEAHAEALFNLAELWTEVHKTERAVRARRILEERYQNSPWAKRGATE